MQNALTTASQARRDEWARVNDLLPWDEAPEWARFAFRHGAAWYWIETPPMIDREVATFYGKADDVDPKPQILTTEHLFRRPGPPKTPSGITRLLQANVPVQLAGKAGTAADPEREALLAYARIIDAARARFGAQFEEVVRDAIK